MEIAICTKEYEFPVSNNIDRIEKGKEYFYNTDRSNRRLFDSSYEFEIFLLKNSSIGGDIIIGVDSTFFNTYFIDKIKYRNNKINSIIDV